MTTMNCEHAEGPIESRTCWLDEEMMEFSMLLPSWQVVDMEGVAHSQGLTLGQLIHLLVRDYLAGRAGPRWPSQEASANNSRQPRDPSGCPFLSSRYGP